MSILSPNAAQFQSLVKKLSDGALAQALQMHSDPSDPKGFWLAQEAMGRKSARDKATTAPAQQPTVVQQLAQDLNPAPAPAPAPMGMPPQMPPQGMPPQMPPQGMPPQMAQAAPPMPPQGLPAAMPPGAPPPEMPVAMAQAGGHVHDYGVASLPYEPRYEEGGIVSFDGTEGSEVKGNRAFSWGYDEEAQKEADKYGAMVEALFKLPRYGVEATIGAAEDIPMFIPRAIGALGVKSKDGKFYRDIDDPEFSLVPNLKAAQEQLTAPIGDNYASMQYDPNQGSSPIKQEPMSPVTSNIFSSAGPSKQDIDKVREFESSLYKPGSSPGPISRPVAKRDSEFSGSQISPQDEINALYSGLEQKSRVGMEPMPTYDSAGARRNFQNYMSNQVPPEALSLEGIMAQRKAALGADPEYNPQYYEDTKKELAGREAQLEKDRGRQALLNLGASLSAVGANPNFLKGLPAFGETMARLGTESDAKFRELQADIDKGRQAIGAARQAAAEGRANDAVNILRDNAESVRNFKNSMNQVEYQGVSDIANKEYESRRDAAKAMQENRNVNAEIQSRIEVARINAILADRKMHAEIQKAANLLNKPMTDEQKFNVILKVIPNIFEETATDFNSRSPGGIKWEDLPPEKQQQEALIYGASRVNAYKRLTQGLAGLTGGSSITSVVQSPSEDVSAP